MIIALVILLLLVWVIFCVILLKLCRQNIEKVSSNFSFKNSNPHYTKKFPEILKSFLTGHNNMLSLFLRIDHVREKLDQSNPFYRGFAYEGAGMGLGARAAIMLRRGARFEKNILKLDPSYIYQYYVGLGWWLFKVCQFNKRGYDQWLKTLDPQYGPILFDGVGFIVGLFHYKTDPSIITKFNNFSADHQRIVYQGFGRSLWFQHEFQLDKVLETIEELPVNHREDILSGVGLAVAYSCFDNLSYGYSAIKLIPTEYRCAFQQGMAFGWEARKLQNQDYWKENLDKFSYKLQSAADHWVDIVRQNKPDYSQEIMRNFYVKWMDKTREKFQEEALNVYS